MRRAASSNAALLLAFSVSAGAHQERKFGVVGVLSADGHAALRQAQRKTNAGLALDSLKCVLQLASQQETANDTCEAVMEELKERFHGFSNKIAISWVECAIGDKLDTDAGPPTAALTSSMESPNRDDDDSGASPVRSRSPSPV